MKKLERAKIVLKLLDKIYPNVPIPLNHKNVYELLISVLLSAQCTDVRVNQVTPELFYIADNFFKKKKVSISQEILNILINRANGDRQNLQNEINKIESFLINKKKIDYEDVLKLTNMSESNNFSELVDYCLAKNEKKLLSIINENHFTNEDTILIIRTFLYKARL